MFGSLRRFLEDNVITDLFNPNTRADQKRRVAQGKSRYYIKGEPAKLPPSGGKPAPASTRTPFVGPYSQEVYDQVITPAYQQQERERQNRISQLQQQASQQRGLVNSLRDVFDANTAKDRLSRVQAKAPETYEDQKGYAPGESRGVVGQLAYPAVGAATNLVASIGTGTQRLLGTGLQALDDKLLPGDVVGAAGRGINQWADIQDNARTQAIDQSRFSTRARQGEMSPLTGLSSAAGSVIPSIAGGWALRAPQAAAAVGGGARGLLAGAKAVSPVAGGFGLSAGGQATREALEAGQSPTTSLVTGLGTGITEAGLEAVGFGKIGKPLINRALSESLQEMSQELGGNVWAKLGYDSEQDLLENVAQAGIYGGIIGGITSPAFDLATNKERQQVASELIKRTQSKLDPKQIQARILGTENAIEQTKQNLQAAQAQGNQRAVNTLSQQLSDLEGSLRVDRAMLRASSMGLSTQEVNEPGAEQSNQNQQPQDINQAGQVQPQLPLGAQNAQQLSDNQLQPTANADMQQNQAIPSPTEGQTAQEVLTGNQQAQQAPGIANTGRQQSSPSGLKLRGFTETVKESQFSQEGLKQSVNAKYRPKSNTILVEGAREKITYSPNEARRKVISEPASDQNVAIAGELIKLYQDKGEFGLAGETADIIAKKLTDAGRAVQAASLYNKLSPEGVLQYAQRVTDGNIPPDVSKELTSMAKDVQKLPTDSIEQQMAIHDMMELIARYKPQSVMNKVIATWKAGLLTAPTTTGGNIVGNTVQGIGQQVSNAVATPIDALVGLFTGERTRAITTRGMLKGLKEGGTAGVKYFKSGFDPRRDPLSKFDTRQVFFNNSKAGKVAETYVNSVFKLMGAQDQPFYYAAFRASLAQQAKVEAKNKGLRGQEAAEFRRDFEQNPNEQALELADQDARTAVFQNETYLGRGAAKAARAFGPLGEFIIPFRGVPSAIATGVLDYSPLGGAKAIWNGIRSAKNGKFDQRTFSQELAKGTIGTFGLMGLGAKLVGAGLMTLDYPDDDNERKLWEIEGRQPFSVKIGGRWVSLNYVQPFATLMAAGGEMRRAADEGETPSAAFTRGMTMMGKAVTEQSFLRGVSGAIGALEDPSRRAEQFMEQTAGSLIPNFIRKGASATDSTEREIEGPAQAVQSGIPGLRQNLTPRRDMFGAEVENKQQPTGIEYVDPFRSQVASDGTPLVQELRRLQDGDYGVTPPRIRDKESFGGEQVQLSQKQVDRLEQLIGPAVETAWQATIRSPEYQQMNDEERQKELRNVSEDVRAAMKVRFMEDNGIGDVKAATDKLSRNQFNLYKQGIKTIPGAQNIDANDNFKVGQTVEQTQDDTTYQQYVDKYNLDTSDQKRGTGQYADLIEKNTASEKITKARNLYKGEGSMADVPDWVKQRYYKEAGVTEPELELDIAAGFKVADKAEYIAQQIGQLQPNERINKLAEWMKPTVSGKYFASYGVIDELEDKGLLSDDQAKALKRLKWDEESNKFVDKYSSSGGSGSGGSGMKYDYKLYGGKFGIAPSSFSKALRSILEEATL